MSWVHTYHDSFALLDDETILEGLERKGYQMEFQCRAGYCGACRTKILSGKVKYIQEPLAFIHPEEVLICSCRPASKQGVTLDIDQRPKPFLADQHQNFASHED